jgi:sulfur relay (sulfurtransferase) complex TusBCD TusD component (DsrE family)
MAESLDQVNQAKRAEENQGKKYSQEDAELATRMGIKLLTEGNGLKVIHDAINQSQQPAQVIGQFLAQMMGQLAEQLQKEAGIDPGVFLAKDGFLDAILNYIEKKLGYPKDFSDKIYGEVLEVIKAAAMGPQAPNDVTTQGQGPQQAPPPPQQEQGGLV